MAQEINASPTVTGFEICSDGFTFDDAKDFMREMMRNFINFRSQIYKINGKWYFKEEFDPDTQDMNKYCNYVDMECKEITDNDTNEEIEEKIFQTAVQYLNSNRAFNVMWNKYKRAHMDGYYLHFKAQKKVVLFMRFNHSLGDGILVSTLVGLLQNKLYDSKWKDMNIDFKHSDNIMPLLSNVLGNKMPNYCML